MSEAALKTLLSIWSKIFIVGILLAIFLAFILGKISKLKKNEIRFIAVSVGFIFLFASILGIVNMKFQALQHIHILLYLLVFFIFFLSFIFPTPKNPFVNFCYLFFLKTYNLEKLYSEFSTRLISLLFCIYLIYIAISTRFFSY